MKISLDVVLYDGVYLDFEERGEGEEGEEREERWSG